MSRHSFKKVPTTEICFASFPFDGTSCSSWSASYSKQKQTAMFQDKIFSVVVVAASLNYTKCYLLSKQNNADSGEISGEQIR